MPSPRFTAPAPHIGLMSLQRTFILPAILALAGCGSSETPQAAPGAVEAATAQLDRNDAAERRGTIERIENEAEQRTDRFEKRIKAIEREQRAN